MSYDQLLQDYLKKIDRYEGLKELSSSVDPVGEVNDILKKLNRDNYNISINSRFRYSVLTGKYGVKNYRSLKIEPFEDFKAHLSEAIACNLIQEQPNHYDSLAKYEKEAVDVAIEIVDSIPVTTDGRELCLLVRLVQRAGKWFSSSLAPGTDILPT